MRMDTESNDTIELSDVRAQYLEAKDSIDAAIAEVVSSNKFIKGEHVSRFEESFAELCGASYCVGVANGTDAIEIALAAFGIVGKDVIIPANTAPATACAVVNSGNKIAFCDCNEHDFTMDVSRLEEAIVSGTKAIVPVHLYGNPCDMETIGDFASENGLLIIEDCAQAHGVKVQGDIGTFSFYPSKNLGAFGDAGAIVTRDREISERIASIADLGRVDKHTHAIHGRNSRLDEIQAAVLCAKLPYLEGWTARRREIARIYCEHLGKEYIPDSVYHQFPILVEDRNQVREKLLGKGIHTGIHYPIVLPRQEAFYDSEAVERCSVACDYAGKLISLPIGIHLSDNDVMKVIDALGSIL